MRSIGVLVENAAALGKNGGAGPPLAALTAGTPLSGVYACTRKDLLVARNGRPYLAVELADRSGRITARAFRNAASLAANFERGDLVQIEGQVTLFRGELVAELQSIQRVDPDGVELARVLPHTRRDLGELDGFFEYLAREITDPPLAALVRAFVDDDEFREQFREAPCTRDGHHAYVGGLLEHTVAVATLAHELCQVHPRLDRSLLLAAALLHDVGKTREFQLGGEITLTREGELIGHLALGQRLVEDRARALPALDDARLDALIHCLLTHHGPELVPGRRFRSAEAAALHRLNQLDAAVHSALLRPAA